MATPIKRRLAVAVAAGACVAGFAASAAQAAIDDPFTFAAPYAGKCSGASIVGNGSTFQNTFNSVAKSGYEGTYCKAK